jgi:GAF domain-containing protein
MYDPRVVDTFFAMHAAEARPTADPASATADVVPAQPAVADQAHASAAAIELEAFFDLGRSLARTASVATTGEALWRSLSRHLPASAFVLFTYDETTDSLVVGYQTGDPGVAAGTRIPLGARLSGWVAAARQPIVNSDARLDLDDALRDASPLRSALAVPIRRGGNGSTAGVLTFYARHPDAFSDAHRRIAAAAAHAVAETAASDESPALPWPHALTR